MRRPVRIGMLAIIIALLLPADPGVSQDAVTDARLEPYRALLADPFANPGHLIADRGAIVWRTAAGPRRLSLERCDLGLGPGRLEGAYARLPRYFADAGRVMDLEARLVWCMTSLQGLSRRAIMAKRFSFSPTNLTGQSDLEALTAFVATKSNGHRLEPGSGFGSGSEHPREREAVALGETLFHRRQGPLDFSCASCHGDTAKRIRLQPLTQFDDAAQARQVMGSWPAYRISQETLRTMQHRLYDCFWQMRLPAIDYGSQVTVALTAYLAAKGRGALIEVPGVKR